VLHIKNQFFNSFYVGQEANYRNMQLEAETQVHKS